MSVQSEIQRLSGNVSAALTAISNKGVTVPTGSKSDDLATLIAQISGGGGSGYTRTIISPERTVTPASNSTYYSATLNVSEGFEADAEYIITFNGTEYFFTCQVLLGTNYLLGDINYFYGGSDLPYPFGIIWTNGTTCTLARDNGNQVTVKIEKLELTGSGGGGDATLITKTITANGTYDAEDDSADGYSSVTVNVPSSAASSWTKVAETSYQVSTTSTSAATVATWATGHNELWTSDKFVYVRIRDTAGKRAGYFYGSDQFFMNTTSVNGGTTTSMTSGVRYYSRYNTNAQFAANTQTGTNGYGVYADTLYSDGRVRIRSRYSSSSSLTIDSTYKVEVYLLDPAGGVPIFE